MSDERNLLGMVGMCRRAGKTVIGTDMVCEYLRRQSEKKSFGGNGVSVIVLEGSDTSDNTHQKISDKCEY